MKATKTTKRDALGRTPEERAAFTERLSGVIREREARELKAPLTAAEIREGMKCLMASPYMKSAKARKGEDPGDPDDFTGAVDTASDVRSDAGPSLYPFAEKWGLEGNIPGVIHELGFTLLMNRTSAEELFRLGTSPEAIALLEEHVARRHEAWVAYDAEKAAASKAAEATS